MTGVTVQLVVDCRDPNALADFWAAALGYDKQWDSSAEPAAPWCAVIDPTGRGPRLVFQRVPEPKSVKNRVHLDLQVGQDRREAEVERLGALGAAELRTVVPSLDPPFRRSILQDPEGNEFCVQ